MIVIATCLIFITVYFIFDSKYIQSNNWEAVSSTSSGDYPQFLLWNSQTGTAYIFGAGYEPTYSYKLEFNFKK